MSYSNIACVETWIVTTTKRPHDERRSPAAGRTLLRELAVQDWVVFVYLSGLWLAALAGTAGSARNHCLAYVAILWAVQITCVLAVRLRIVGGPFAAAFWYRVGVAAGQRDL